MTTTLKSFKLPLAIAAIGILSFAANAQIDLTNGILPAPVAVGAVSNVNFAGSNVIITDSYNSHDTNYSINGQYSASMAKSNGNVACVAGFVNFGAQVINGNLYLGPKASYAGSGIINGTIYSNYNFQLPDVKLPVGANSWPIAISTNIPVASIGNKGRIMTNTITAYHFTTTGNYIVNQDLPMVIESGIIVNLNVISTTFSGSGLYIYGGITNAGTAKLYFNGPSSITISGNTTINPNTRPENLWYIGLPSLTSVTISSSATFAGVIYAPEVNLTLNGGGLSTGISGSVIVQSIQDIGHYQIHFDESLASGFGTPTNIWITSQPTNTSAVVGANATFTASVATSVTNAAYWYDWYYNQTNLLASGTNYFPLSTNSTLTLTNVQLSNQGFYFVSISNANGGVISSNAYLTVTVPPVPPAITAQPTNLLVFPGTNVAFGVSLTGSAPLRYQWQLNGTNLLDATNAVYIIPSVTTNNAGNYSLVVTNAAGMAVSSNAALTVVVSPGSQTNSATSTVTFTVNAFGPELLNYQWQINGTNLVDGGNISGSTNNQLTIASISDSDAANYSAVVSDATSSLTTSNTTLTVIDSPFIITQPLSQTALVGSDVTFSATVYGAPPLVFQWYYNNTPVGLPVSGTNVAFYTITNAQITDSGSYSVQVMNGYDSVMSSNAILTVHPPVAPTIIQQPANLTATIGYSATFSVTASGTAPLSYQWQFNGTNLADGGNISGSATSTLTITNVSFSQSGYYAVLVTNVAGSALSFNALLTVNLFPPCDPAPFGLVSWWPAEGNASDIIGTNNGTPIGGVNYTNGEVGQAFVFNGITSYIPVPTSPSLDIGMTGSGITIEGWVKPNAAINLGDPIVEWDSASSDGLALWVDTSFQLFANVKDTGNNAHVIQSAPNSISTNSLQHVALTYDKSSGAAMLFINGAMVVSNNIGNVTPLTTQPTYTLNIGRRTGQPIGNGDTFNGLIDELGLYNRALSPAEIAAIYNAGSTGKCPPVNPPSITIQPTNQTVIMGGTATFLVTASNATPLSYQWQKNGTNLIDVGNISGSASNLLTIANASDTDAASYDVVVSNSIGSVTSSNATLMVIDPPMIAVQPTNQQTLLGGSVSFTVSVSGTPPLQYQWQLNLTNILNATNATYAIPAAAVTDGGIYSVVVTNIAGGVTSSNALLTVNVPPAVSLQFSNGSPVLNVSGMLSSNFVVQYNTDLTTTNWVDLTSISNLTASPYQFIDPDGLNQQARFYRVIMR